ncbi:hypothetical protein AB0G60_24430 [Streptomyces angustmyceticus]|uniref:Uncharacterized protein n=1 Tax=Streptomyces angustmyceticus TaxID=285578 RepID=A0A5J4LBE8_9ACTN|nr:hypothetical protein [Streptomyces angustmyceticus]UAL66095.1 hypothetical protein K7396_05720 [Streptomyces angustmyceticus]GES29171.1 hypothetical protein San01_16580 [Streptomyces angustmyceticus]
MVEVYESDRRFKVWQYTVSHRRLLLRSSREEYGTRIDILFAGVEHMCIKRMYDGLVIRQGTEEDARRISEALDIEVDVQSLYLLGHGISSFVISGRPQWREDDGYNDAPSRLGHLPGTP